VVEEKLEQGLVGAEITLPDLTSIRELSSVLNLTFSVISLLVADYCDHNPRAIASTPHHPSAKNLQGPGNRFGVGISRGDFVNRPLLHELLSFPDFVLVVVERGLVFEKGRKGIHSNRDDSPGKNLR